MSKIQTWGLSATILAPAAEILRFAAYHLETGAHRLYLYLDDENPAAYAPLKAHPKIRVTTCDASHWKNVNGGRPHKHQVRQTVNATHAYARRVEVDWLVHMDVDEFLVSERPLTEHLSNLSPDIKAARFRPMEALSGDANVFKGFIPPDQNRGQIVSQIYPTFGKYIKGGFLSHLAGKTMVRTGLDDVRVQIHNAFQGDTQIETVDFAQTDVALAHCHAKTWEQWIAAYRYRLTKGSYRAELAPNKPRDKGGISMHALFCSIEENEGESGLRAFFDEVCADTPVLREHLRKHGLLFTANLDLNGALSKHFPDMTR